MEEPKIEYHIQILLKEENKWQDYLKDDSRDGLEINLAGLSNKFGNDKWRKIERTITDKELP